MKAHEIYNTIDPALVTRMLDWFRENDRNVYRSALASLAQSRKLRLVFVQKKPVVDQYAWILKTLKSKQSDTIGEHLLQAWLMAGNQDMLAKFCDEVGIEHDGKGSVTGDLPEELSEETVDKAVDALVADFDPKLVTLYLTVFNLQKPGGWPALSAKLESDDRLSLS
ncbi:hypothetical protein [Haloferula rosea]|uniref:Uncharacterized protein n=1 Tax=Haloferula rosea TaxID=490093 RepID=A0A934RIQ5_9BACT|nr:hypothetical protein [Haloferula rosea]MBK1829005.1 hypothetical protein [Haloferula rosea]